MHPYHHLRHHTRATLTLATWLTFIAMAGSQHNTLALRYGIGHYARQDQTFSPFVHPDWSALNIGLTYTHHAKMYQFADLEFGSYNPILVPSYDYDEDKQTLPHNFTLVNLTYALGHSLRPEGDATGFILGGFFEADVEPSNYNYARWSNFGYLATFSLGAWGQYDCIIHDKHTLRARAMLPLLSLVARSPYLVNDDEYIENTYSHNGFKTFFAYLGDGEFQTLNRIQQFELHLNYAYALSNKWHIGAGYSFRMIHAVRPTDFLSFRNTFYLTASLNF